MVILYNCRRYEEDRYKIYTFESIEEIPYHLDGAEILSMRSLCNYGIILTHGEWAFLAPHLELCSIQLSEYLLEGKGTFTFIEPFLVEFLERLLLSHLFFDKPSFQFKVCMKLLPLLKYSKEISSQIMAVVNQKFAVVCAALEQKPLSKDVVEILDVLPHYFGDKIEFQLGYLLASRCKIDEHLLEKVPTGPLQPHITQFLHNFISFNILLLWGARLN